MKWNAPFFPLRSLPDDAPRIEVELEKVNDECATCGEPGLDACYNCEEVSCREHVEPWIFTKHPTVVFGLCPSCSRYIKAGMEWAWSIRREKGRFLNEAETRDVVKKICLGEVPEKYLEVEV